MKVARAASPPQARCVHTDLVQSVVVIALYTGSFDPIHAGHVALVEQAARLFDQVVVAVLGNPAKVGLFTKQERVDLVSACVAGLPNVSVISHEGMAVDAAHAVNASCIVRSGHKELQSEFDMAAMNHALSAIPTVFLDPNEETTWVSSTAVRSAAAEDSLASVGSAVPIPVVEALRRRGKQPR